MGEFFIQKKLETFLIIINKITKSLSGCFVKIKEQVIFPIIDNIFLYSAIEDDQ